MKLSGSPMRERFTRTIELPRPDGTSLPLTLRPLPLGYHARLRERGIAPPAPPTRVARDSQGRPIRDERTMAILVADENDPAHLAAVEQYHQRVAVLVVAEALGADPRIEFETAAPRDDRGWAEYADALYAELADAGFSDGDLVRLCGEVCRMSNLLDDHLREAGRNFSSTPPPTS
ncbi:MAG: hypothetical protein WD066_01980 [Planctomycetaceae bacterium]